MSNRRFKVINPIIPRQSLLSSLPSVRIRFVNHTRGQFITTQNSTENRGNRETSKLQQKQTKLTKGNVTNLDCLRRLLFKIRVPLPSENFRPLEISPVRLIWSKHCEPDLSAETGESLGRERPGGAASLPKTAGPLPE